MGRQKGERRFVVDQLNVARNGSPEPLNSFLWKRLEPEGDAVGSVPLQ
jgi:hypothetical protein